MRPHSQLDANAPRWRTVIGYGTAASVWIVSTDLLAHEYAPGSFLQLELFSDFTPARLNLARLLNELGRNPDAEHVLRDGIARVPDEGELHYSLGLLLGEEERLPEAAAALGRAADLMPARARVRYNEALALQRLGRRADAEAAFVKAQNTDPEDPDVAYALAVLYAQQSDWSRARDAAARLAALSPGNPQVQELIDRISSAVTLDARPGRGSTPDPAARESETAAITR